MSIYCRKMQTAELELDPLDNATYGVSSTIPKQSKLLMYLYWCAVFNIYLSLIFRYPSKF